jgi:alpha-1,3-glucan synthase
MGAFYNISFNRTGVKIRLPLDFLPAFIPTFLRPHRGFDKLNGEDHHGTPMMEVAESSAIGVLPLATTAISKPKRTVLLATLEYDIEDWSIKIKIGGLGVMAQLMGKNLPHHDIIWVVPCVGGVDYPIDTPAESMSIAIAGAVYEVQVQYHKLRNITYVLLDAPIFRQQTKSEPYPPRMDDLHSAIYYSAWNCCIAETVKRFPIDIYHINDYHGAIAPLYLLPRTIPCCLSLHNAEFQGLWPLRNKKELDEISEVFNLNISVIRKYVQFGEVFNLLHAGASYLRVHQRGFGAVGVSNKYGDRSYARYPIFWGLKEIGKLPNPDPSDTEPWDPEAEARQVIQVDPAYEKSRGIDRCQAQEWAGLQVDPTAELFVFVGRWSVQKGVDLIADVFPAILEKHSNVQLICVGPVIDMYGKFAALKLQEMMTVYPGRVFSKPEFTALPPFIFTGAEFALIPSRDEPFGLVAVEFGRKGALGVGALVGGLGQMPGWWFPVESMTVKHLQKQFKSSIESAIGSKQQDRAMMRANSAKQRFPVARWVEDLDYLQLRSIRMHEQQNDPSRRKRGISHVRNISQTSLVMIQTPSANVEEINTIPQSSPTHLSDKIPSRTLSLGVRSGPGHQLRRTVLHEGTALTPRLEEVADPDEQAISAEEAEAIVNREFSSDDVEEDQRGRSSSGGSKNLVTGLGISRAYSPDQRGRLRSSSVLSLDQIRGTRQSFSLESADPTFKDETGKYSRYFQGLLQRLNGKNSENDLCIDDFIVKSEKEWSDNLRQIKLGRGSSRSPSPLPGSRSSPSLSDNFDEELDGDESIYEDLSTRQLLQSEGFERPPAVQRWLATRIFGWPIYTILLALGQIMAANSTQITLLTSGSAGGANVLYILGSIYIVTTCAWWFAFRRVQSVYLLSLPFVLYGLAFFFIGIAAFIPSTSGQTWVYHIATAFYIIGSSSGYLFFSLNFGDDGGSKIESWVYRACLIQGTQNVYVAALFFWGSEMSPGSRKGPFSSPGVAAGVTMPIAVLLFVAAGAVFAGLPKYYRQTPGKIPAFYKSIFRRKIIIWFSVTVVLQNYFLSMPYERNWAYLWGSKYAPRWMVLLLALAFFIGVWYMLLAVLAWRTKTHSWILPIFAIGLGAPRWAQMLWGTSGIGLWVPWIVGGPRGSALGGRILWLWLGVLDSIQGVGFGMMLLQTLTRIHIAASLCAAQLIGTVTTLVARASAPDRDGPGDVFPDFSAGIIQGISKPWFWIALSCQLAIPIGFFMFFRKEQLTKP